MISILIIGNEILSAQVEDINLKHMLGKLNQAGYVIDEVRIVRDDVETIGKAIRELSATSTYVISSGGIGPTHDDVTLDAFARAFGVSLITHPELERKIRDYFKDEVKESSLRMAIVPENTELVPTKSSWPLIKVANCFVLPGLPEIFIRKFEGIMAFLPKAPNRYFAQIFTATHETDFADVLARLQTRFPAVEMGSYPTYEHSEYAARITFKSEDVATIRDAFGKMYAHFEEKHSLVRTEPPRKVNNPGEPDRFDEPLE